MNERSNDSLLPMIATAGALSAAAIGAALAYKSMTRNLAKKASSAISDAIESKTSSSISTSNPKSARVKNINTSGTSSATPSNHRKTIEELNASAGSNTPRIDLSGHNFEDMSREDFRDWVLKNAKAVNVDYALFIHHNHRQQYLEHILNNDSGTYMMKLMFKDPSSGREPSPEAKRLLEFSSKINNIFNDIENVGHLNGEKIDIIHDTPSVNNANMNSYLTMLNNSHLLEKTKGYITFNTIDDFINSTDKFKDFIELASKKGFVGSIKTSKYPDSNLFAFNHFEMESLHSDNIDLVEQVASTVFDKGTFRFSRDLKNNHNVTENTTSTPVQQPSVSSPSSLPKANVETSELLSNTPSPQSVPIPQSSQPTSYQPNTSLDLVDINFNRPRWDESAKKTVTDNVTSNIFDYSGRKMVVVNVDGINMPFYLSTGHGGKAGVPAGKWYPFFGVGQDGWINKTHDADIVNYYGSKKLGDVSRQLDTDIGDIRNLKNIEKGGSDLLNKINNNLSPHITPVDNDGKGVQTLKDNINKIVGMLDNKTAQDSTHNFSSTKPSSHNYDVSRFIPINGALPDDVLKFISEAEDYQVDAINNFIESFNRVSSPDFLQKVNADRTNKLSSNFTLSFFGLSKTMSKEEALINPGNYAVTAQSETLSDIVKQSKDIFDIHYDVHAPGIILHDNTTNQSVLAHKALLDGYITDIGSTEPSQTHLQMTMDALRKFSKND